MLEAHVYVLTDCPARFPSLSITMKPKFEPTKDGLEIIDQIERHRYQLTMNKPVHPKRVDPNQIQFPVASAIGIITEEIILPTNDTVYIRDKSGSMVAEVRPNKQVTLPQSEYILDLSGPMKVYAHVESTVDIYSDTKRTYISLEKETHAIIGARSYHRRPAGTITTTEKPTDVMSAVSTFGSALKSITPERSYPTYRGHPPAIELGDKLNIPKEFERPDTGVQVEIPPTLRHVFIVTPLAYYLGAEVVPGSEPQIKTRNGFVYELEKKNGFESTVERVLKQIFFLDCITRTEGATPLPLYERQVVEEKLEFNIKKIYNQPLVEQLKTYLSIPFGTIESVLPNWRLETRLDSTREMAEFLPFIAADLAIVSVQKKDGAELPDAQDQTLAIEEFTRNGVEIDDKWTHGNNCSHNSGNITTSIQQSWKNGKETDIVSTTPLSAFYNSLGRTPRETPLEIVVICNDSSMEQELETVNTVYGNREELPFDVEIHHNTTTKALENVLVQEKDFVHYIGHTDEDGLQCSDGKLDSSTLNTVGAKAFLLNACQSRKQGLHLIKAGSLGGIVTLDDIVNSGAIQVGSTIARLLNQGFPLYAALDVAQKESVTGTQYQMVGDGTTTIAQSKTGAPNICFIDKGEDDIKVKMETYVSSGTEKGSLFVPYLESVDIYYILPGSTEMIPATKSQTKDFLKLQDVPVIVNDSIKWSQNIAIEEL